MVRVIQAVIGVCALILSSATPAQLLYEEGKHYFPLDAPVATQSGDKAEVVEVFSYGCPHCYEFEESLEPWLASLPDTIEFRRVPASLGRQFFAQMAAAYYLADEFDVLDQTHSELFKEVHEKRNRALSTIDGMAEFFGRFGITREQVESGLTSEKMQEQFAAGETAIRGYQITGVPSLVVGGKFRIGRNEHVTSYPMMLEVAEFLAAAENAQ